MPVETILTRTLGIRFMDARRFANEAKLNLGIEGYPTASQEELLVKEAIRMYESSTIQTKQSLKKAKDEFDAIKISRNGANDSFHSCQSDSGSSNDSVVQDEKRYERRRVFWRTKNR